MVGIKLLNSIGLFDNLFTYEIVKNVQEIWKNWREPPDNMLAQVF